MTSSKGIIIGGLIIIFGFIVLSTIISPTWLDSIGIKNVKIINMLNTQARFWYLPIGILIIIVGLVIMSKMDS